MMQLRRVVLLAGLLALVCTVRNTSAEEPEPSTSRRIGLLNWHTDYLAAYKQARTEHKQLLVFFRDETAPAVANSYEKSVLASDFLWIPLSGYVRAALPLETHIPAPGADGKTLRLIDHPAFEQLRKRQGIVTIDLSQVGAGPYGTVTAAHPFTPRRHYTVSSTSVVLGLPRGTLTQRALIYALRMHPEGPRLANKGMNTYLADQASRHSAVMARLEQVGHHDWGTRFHSISSAVHSSVNEVAASGNGETIVDAAVSCVAAWRSSPGHWSLITSNPLLYGYDLVRGQSGQWYATGIISSGQ